MTHTHIAVIGTGSWGTALAQHLAHIGHMVRLWGRDAALVAEINTLRRNDRYLPAIVLHDGITACADLGDAVRGADTVLLVTPAQTMPALRAQLDAAGAADKTIVLCSKGIMLDTGGLPTDCFAGHTRLAVLTGPTFAREVAMGLPAAATLACADEQLGADLVRQLGGPMFRLYWTPDVIGAQAAGALKNVLAIACGIVDGLGLGDNARAALITRGVAEIARFVRAKGGQVDTLMGLCGIGDIVLTCASNQSRNYALGLSLGQGKDIHTLLPALRSVPEGVPTSAAIGRLLKDDGLELPICQGVAAIVSGQASVHQIMDALLQRPLRTGREV